MNKKFKLASIFLASSLIISPIVFTLENNNAQANYNTTNKKIKSIETISDYEIFQVFEEAYNKGELNITKEQYQELKTKSFTRGYWGANKTVTFWDGARDEYISGFVIDIFLTVGSAGVGTLISRVPRLANIANSVTGGWKGFGYTLMGRILSSNLNLSNGIVAYYRPNGKHFVKYAPSGSNYSGNSGYWATTYQLSHIRSQ